MESQHTHTVASLIPLDSNEKPEPYSNPLLLHGQTQFLSTAFVFTRSTHLHFTLFPPPNVPKPSFQRISVDAATALLHEDRNPTFLSPVATTRSVVVPTGDIQLPSKLPADLVTALRGAEWCYYIVHDNAPTALGSATGFKHHLAIRKLRHGTERYAFAAGGLSTHSICEVREVGVQHVEDVPRETLYLEETTEILCNWMLKWWLESQMSTRVAENHECFRVKWDERFRAEWEGWSMREKADLLS